MTIEKADKGTQPASLIGKYGNRSKAAYSVKGRGRPELSPEEAAVKIIRRHAFGRHLQELRLSHDMSVNKAAKIAGIDPPRKLAHYEGTCYPAGEAIMRLAHVYGVKSEDLAMRMIYHSEPDLYEALTGKEGHKPSIDEIRQEITQTAARKLKKSQAKAKA